MKWFISFWVVSCEVEFIFSWVDVMAAYFTIIKVCMAEIKPSKNEEGIAVTVKLYGQIQACRTEFHQDVKRRPLLNTTVCIRLAMLCNQTLSQGVVLFFILL